MVPVQQNVVLVFKETTPDHVKVIPGTAWVINTVDRKED